MSSDLDSDTNESIKNVDTKVLMKMNEQLTTKELNATDEPDLSSDSSDYETFEYRKNETTMQTKEQKQKQNEEIVISTSLSERNGTVLRDLDRRNTTENIYQNCQDNDKSNSHFFIDASSLLDETELCYTSLAVQSESPKPSNSKLTKLKVGDVPESQEFKTAEFQKEIKVENVEMKLDFNSKPPVNYLRQESEPCSSRYTEKQFSSLDSTMLNKELYYPEKFNLNSFTKSHQDVSEVDKKSFHLNSLTKSHQDISEPKKSFVRSGTFEIDPEEAMLRKNNERRQGSLVFQNSIQQYSTHNLSSENLMPATPFNSICHVNDTVILNPSKDRPLDSIFYEKNKNPEEIIAEDSREKSDEELDLKPIKREESIPIISGGICPLDCRPAVHASKKDVDNIPCISTASTNYVEAELCSSAPKNVIKTAWVIDMNSTESKKNEIEVKEKPCNSNKSSLGFFVDLSDVPTEKKVVKSPPKSEEEKKNIFSMFIDFQAPKKEMPSRLSQSLCAKKEKNSNSEMSKSTNSIKKENENQNVNGVVQIRHKRSSSNVTNRHSWNGNHENDTHFHTRTYSLSDKQFKSLNIEINTQTEDSNTNGSSLPVDNGLENIKEDQQIIEDIKIEEIYQQIEENHREIEDDHQIEQDSIEHIQEQNTQEPEIKTETKIPEIIETQPVESQKSDYVSLSDLYKPVPKIVTTEQPVYTRMTRSIPETSWIESKLLMTRSIGYRTSSKLLPNMSTSTPSNFFSKSSGQDSDEMMSEVSDFSSIQSSTALEISTEDTSQSYSSSYQVHQSTNRLGSDLLRMFLEEISPDVTVEVGGRHLKAHKCILSSRCQYFAAMLSGGWVESSGNIISLQGFSYQAVYFAMCHIYSGAADIPETIDLVEMATLADMLGLEGLKEIVANTLKLKYCHLFHKPCSVCVVGVLECLPLAAAYGLDELYRKALKWITRYFVRVWATRTFASLSRELLDKCYQQHVIHMSADNILETVLCVDKLLITLPNVRWAEIVHELTAQLADACQLYIMQHFSSVLASASFLSLGKELNWNISKLENGLLHAAEHLSPEQACRSYARIHKLQSFLEVSDECWSENFMELVHNIFSRVQDCVVRQAVRVSHTSSWSKLDPNLRARIQELSCLPLEHTYVVRQSRSTSGSRNLDLRQIKIAMQQHSRRAQSTDSRVKKVEPKPKPVEPQPPRPRTWPAQSHIKTKIISSSDSSRTSSPAMKKLNKKNEIIKNKSVSNNTVNKTKSNPNLIKPKNDKKIEVKPIVKKEPVKTVQQNTLTKTKPKPNNVLKSNVQKTEKVIKQSSVNKENRTNSAKQSKSGSSSSTQQSPSLLNKNRQTNSTNTSTPSSQNRSESNAYSSSPSLRRSLLLAARAPQVPVKPVSPATNKRLARIQASNSLTSPTKSSAAKCVNAKKVIKQKSVEKKNEIKEQKPKVQVERSGTFLKDEPTVFNKN